VVNKTKTIADAEEWTAKSERRLEPVQWSNEQAVTVAQMDHYPVYFYAPKRFLGDQRFAYNQMIVFSLRVGQEFAERGPKYVLP
jgi:hypothetical protein